MFSDNFRFEERLGFPGALANVDYTLINLHTPQDHEEAYLDHEGHHSLNVQVVSSLTDSCDCSLQFLTLLRENFFFFFMCVGCGYWLQYHGYSNRQWINQRSVWVDLERSTPNDDSLTEWSTSLGWRRRIFHAWYCKHYFIIHVKLIHKLCNLILFCYFLCYFGYL